MAAKSISHTVSLTVDNISLNFSDSITSGDSTTSYAMATQTVTAAAALNPIPYSEIDPSACNVMILMRNEEAVVSSAGAADSDHKNLLVDFNGGSTPTYPIVIKPQTTALFSMGSNVSGATSVNLSNIRVRSGDGSASVECRYLLVQTESSS